MFDYGEAFMNGLKYISMTTDKSHPMLIFNYNQLSIVALAKVFALM